MFFCHQKLFPFNTEIHINAQQTISKVESLRAFMRWLL